jgi:hypothetical protein
VGMAVHFYTKLKAKAIIDYSEYSRAAMQVKFHFKTVCVCLREEKSYVSSEQRNKTYHHGQGSLEPVNAACRLLTCYIWTYSRDFWLTMTTNNTICPPILNNCQGLLVEFLAELGKAESRGGYPAGSLYRTYIVGTRSSKERVYQEASNPNDEFHGSVLSKLYSIPVFGLFRWINNKRQGPSLRVVP